MNLRSTLLHTMKNLSEGGIELPGMEARILLSHVLREPQEFLIMHSEREIDLQKFHDLEALIARRKAFEPIAYITGIKEFFGRDFVVDKNVLLPRPDSETLIEAILKNPPKGENILELGVGSGCLIITLLLELQNITAIGIDIDKYALNIAKTNARKHGIPERLELIESDWFDNLGDQKFDLIISNPPYISSEEKVAKETMLYEPHKALFAANNGLAAYIEIARRAKDFLKVNGMLYLEIGYDQEVLVTDLFLKNGYRTAGKYKDLAGYVRCLSFRR